MKALKNNPFDNTEEQSLKSYKQEDITLKDSPFIGTLQHFVTGITEDEMIVNAKLVKVRDTETGKICTLDKKGKDNGVCSPTFQKLLRWVINTYGYFNSGIREFTISDDLREINGNGEYFRANFKLPNGVIVANAVISIPTGVTVLLPEEVIEHVNVTTKIRKMDIVGAKGIKYEDVAMDNEVINSNKNEGYINLEKLKEALEQ